MLRTPIALCGGALLLAIIASAPAQADELPLRKAGLWEVKQTFSMAPSMSSRQCTDETVDKMMTGIMLVERDLVCSKRDIRKTATGYVMDLECGQLTWHFEYKGDFSSAYVMTQTTKGKGKMTGLEETATLEAKWLGVCTGDLKPGDIIDMSDGTKMNAMEFFSGPPK